MKKMVVCLLCALALRAQTQSPPPDPLQARFDALIEQGLKDDPMPGIAVGIVQHGKLVYARGFGVMTIGHPEKPITPQTLFHMASITKPFVATAIMQLWEQGKLDLDAPVTKYLPYFKLDDPRYQKITIRQMLSHSSGLPDVEDYEWSKPQLDDGALERYVRSLGDRKLKMLFDPGAGMAYSNMAYEVLGDVIAKVSGMTFEDYVEQNILRPLGMNNSTLLLSRADKALLADGYTRPRGGDYGSIRPIAAYPFNRAHSPSSDLMSNVNDMARWALANMNHGELDGKRILKSSTLDLMWKPTTDVEFCRGAGHTDCRKPGGQVGISWFLSTKDGHTFVSHSGGDDGFMTNLILVPDAGMALILACNSEHPGVTLPQKISHEFVELVKSSAEPDGRE